MKSTKPRRWRLIALGAGIIVLLILIHLFWPVSPPSHSLLALMPGEMAVGIELRSGSAVWRKVRDEQAVESLLKTPLAEALRPITAERGIDLAARLQQAADRIDTMLDSRGGMPGRALAGSVAIATTDTRMKDAVVLAHVDNLTAWGVWLALKTKGVNTSNLPTHLVVKRKNNRTMYVTQANGLIVSATSPTRLKDALQSVKTSRAPHRLVGNDAFPAESVVLHVRPNGEYREAVHRRLGTEFWLVREGLLIATRNNAGLDLEGFCLLRPEIMNRYLDLSKQRAENKEDPRPWAVPAALPAETFNNAGTAWTQGWVAPEFAWHSLSRKLWDEPARPLRGDSRPATVFFWNLIDKGIVRHGDGRFVVALSEATLPESLQGDNGGVPPAPHLEAVWGVRTSGETMIRDLHAETKNLVDWFRAPGGPELFEDVREDTAVSLGQDDQQRDSVMNIRLQPLFFNHMEPLVLAQHDPAEAHFVNYSLGSMNALQYMPTRAPVASADEFADITFGWHVSDKMLSDLRALVENKAIRHAFAPEETHPAIRKGLDIYEALAKTVPQGKGEACLRRLDNETWMIRATLSVR